MDVTARPSESSLSYRARRALGADQRPPRRRGAVPRLRSRSPMRRAIVFLSTGALILLMAGGSLMARSGRAPRTSVDTPSERTALAGGAQNEQPK